MSYLKALAKPALWGMLASLLIIWSCHVANEEAAFFDVEVDSTWTRFDSVAVVLADSDGSPLDTLFKGTLLSEDQLKKLNADGFGGGKIQVILIGYVKDEIAKRESRPYDGRTGVSGEKIVVIIAVGGDDALDLKPDAAKLYTGGPDITLAPSGAGWEEKTLDWSSSKEDVASVTAENGAGKTSGIVKALAPGKTWIKAVSGSLMDSSEITVITDPPVLDAGEDTVIILNSTLSFQVKMKQEFGTIAVFKWSLDGDTLWDDSASGFPEDKTLFSTTPITYPEAANLQLRFYMRDGEGNSATATRMATVSNKAPKITSLLKDTEINIKDSVAFTAQVEVNLGLLKKFTWDYGDGSATVSGDLSADKQELTGGHRFPTEGIFKVTLAVEDDAGNQVKSSVTVTVKRDPPTAKAGDDTTVTAGARVNLHGKASDLMGSVAKTEWKIGEDAYFPAPNPDTNFTAPSVGGVIVECLFRVTDDDGLVAVDTVKITVSAPADADLSALALSAGTLSPAFSRANTVYTASVANTVTSLTVTPTAAASGSTIKVNTVAVAGGTASGPIPLAVGPNTINVEVTAQGGLKKTYAITVTRAGSAVASLSALTASAGTLSPAFAAGTLPYTVTTTDTTTTITPTVTAGSGATVKVNGVATVSGAASAAIRIPAGTTTIVPVAVTAQDGTVRTYTIAFTVGTPGLPDLSFTSATITSKTPTRVDYSYTITNSGGTIIPNLSNVSIQNFWSDNTIFNDAGDVAAGGSILGIAKSLAPGESHSGTFYASGAVPAGLKYVTFKIDWGDSVAESNESNNTEARLVLVPPTAKAGNDTTVSAGTRINLRGQAADPLGSVVKTEWKVGAGAYFNAPLPDTNALAPAVGGTVIKCLFRVTDDDGLVTEDTMEVTVTAAADADLSALALSAGTLAPAFTKANTAYTASVANTVASLTVTPTVANGGATVKVNTVAVPSGTASGAVALVPGPNTVNVEVTAQSGLKKTYVVTVTRALSSVNTLSALTATAGTLSPVFAAGTLPYTVNPSAGTTTITATVTAGSGATVKVNGVTTASGTASAAIALPAGTTTSIPVLVTAQNGTTRTYTIAFTVPGTGLPDLVFTASAITSVTATRVNYSYTIKNNGGSTIPNLSSVSIQNFYSVNNVFNDAGDDAAGGSILGITKALAPGESHSGTYYGSGAIPTGMKYLTFKIDWGEIIAETNETNNTRALLLP